MTAGTAGAAALAERYLRAIAAQDWATVAACVAPDVVRLGPFGDDVEGRGPYLELLQRTMPALPGYRLDIDAATEVGGGRVFVELRETVEIDGTPLLTHECLVVDVDLARGAVARVAIYIRRDGGPRAGG
jgi:hypothetical protein